MHKSSGGSSAAIAAADDDVDFLPISSPSSSSSLR
jgi:hypothetical protein